MKLKIIVREAEEGGFSAEAPSLPGCTAQGATMEALILNMREAIDSWLRVDIPEPAPGAAERIVELVL